MELEPNKSGQPTRELDNQPPRARQVVGKTVMRLAKSATVIPKATHQDLGRDIPTGLVRELSTEGANLIGPQQRNDEATAVGRLPVVQEGDLGNQ